MSIRRNDMVVVIAGDDAGAVPRKVLEVVEGGRRIVVEGVNRAYKHVKRNHPRSPAGGRLSLEMPIDASNAQFYCDHCKRGVRLGMRYADDGSKVRFCRKCQASAGVVSPARAAYAKKS